MEPLSATSCRLHAKIRIKVDLPVVGATIERGIEQLIQKAYDDLPIRRAPRWDPNATENASALPQKIRDRAACAVLLRGRACARRAHAAPHAQCLRFLAGGASRRLAWARATLM